MSRDEDDDFSNDVSYEDNRGNATDVGSTLKDRVKTENGKLKVFGWEFDVGPQAAVLISPLVTTGINWASLSGASAATKYGTNLSTLVVGEKYGTKVGTGLGRLWLYGLPMMEVMFGVKRTVTNGFKDMYALREQAQPLLAANHNMDVSLSKALTSKFGVLADARARVWATGKRDFIGNIVGIVRALPTIFMGRFQTQLNDMVKNGIGTEGTTTAGTATHTVGHENNPLMSVFRFMTDPGFKERFDRVRKKTGSQLDHRQVISDLNSMPALADLAAGFIERRVTKQDGKEIAWDKIMQLQEYVTRHKHNPERGGIVSHVRDIFQQRAQDLKKHYQLEGSGFERVTDAIADAIATGLHPQALAEILDNRKIVSFDAKDADFGDIDDVKEQLLALKEKYTKKVSEKQFYKNAAFTKDTLLETFKKVPQEEKAFFVMLFPQGILEKAGVSKEEVRTYRKESKDYFVGELTDIVRLMAEEGRKELKQHGVRDKLIDKLETFQQGIERGGIEKNLDEATELVRNIAASAKNQDEFWRAYMRKRGIEGAESSRKSIPKRTALDHVERDAGDDANLPDM